MAKAKKTSSKKEKVVVEKVVEPVVEPVADVSDVVMDDSGVSYGDEFASLVQMADDLLKLARDFKARVAKLEKTVARDHKQLEKKVKGKRRRVANPDAPPQWIRKAGPCIG